MNFLIAELCDNDYGHDLKEALQNFLLLVDHPHNFSVDIVKQYLVESVVYQKKARHILFGQGSGDAERSFDYLTKHLKVYWSNKFPRYYEGGRVDHDGGSAYLNVYLNEVGTF